MRATRGHGSYPRRQYQSTAAGLCLCFEASSPHATCQGQTFAAKVTWVSAAVVVGALYCHPFALEAVAALEACGLVVAGAGLVHCPRTALNPLYHLAPASLAEELYHPVA
jgi:hypothetical protein